MSTKTAVQRETVALVLDASVPLEEMIRRGNYGYVNERYTQKNFTLTLTGNREIVLVNPKGYVSSEEMVDRMKAERYVPALIDDALAMGAQFPERQRFNPIVFLGTVFRDPIGYRHVLMLGDWDGWRGLRLDWFGGGWRRHCRFAAVRES